MKSKSRAGKARTIKSPSKSVGTGEGSAARISPAMVDAYDLAKANGGKLVKHRGGFWAGKNWTYLQPYAGTKTIEALVKRGMAYVSANHTDSFRRTYPTEITIKPFEPNTEVTDAKRSV